MNAAGKTNEIVDPLPVLPSTSITLVLAILTLFVAANVASAATVISKVVAYPSVGLTAAIVEEPNVPVSDVRFAIVIRDVSTASENTMRIVSPGA